MDWYSVPSLQFQSALKIVTSIYSRPSVIRMHCFKLIQHTGHLPYFYDDYKDWPKEYHNAVHKKVTTELIKTLALPPVLEKLALDLVYPILKQVHHFYAYVKYIFERDSNCSFPLKSKAELISYICWNSEGWIDLEKTAQSFKSIVDNVEHDYSDYLLTCSYIVDRDLYSFWKGEFIDGISEEEINFFNALNYQSYETAISSVLSSHEFFLEAAKRFVYYNNFFCLKKCWLHLSSAERSQLIEGLLSKSYGFTSYSYYLEDVNIIRYCALNCTPENKKEDWYHVLPFGKISFKPDWVYILLKFWFYPNKDLFYQLSKIMLKLMDQSDFYKLLEDVTNNKFIHVNANAMSHVFRDLWIESPKDWKIEFLDDNEEQLKKLLFGNHHVTKVVASALLDGFDLDEMDEKREFLDKYGLEICAKMCWRDFASLDWIWQKCLFYDIDLKNVVKNCFFPKTDCVWLLTQRICVTKKLVSWIKLSAYEEQDVKQQLTSYIIREALDMRRRGSRALIFKCIEWCITDENEQRMLKKIIWPRY